MAFQKSKYTICSEIPLEFTKLILGNLFKILKEILTFGKKKWPVVEQKFLCNFLPLNLHNGCSAQIDLTRIHSKDDFKSGTSLFQQCLANKRYPH